MQVNSDHLRDPAHDSVAFRETTPIEGAVSDRHHPLGLGSCDVRPLKRLAHVFGNRPGYRQHVGMARRGNKAQAKTFQIVESIAERMDFQLAAVA